MTRPEFALELRNAINDVVKTNKISRKSDIEIKIDGKFKKMALEVRPVKIDWEEPLLLIVFTSQESNENLTSQNNGKQTETQKDKIIKKLTEDLINARAEIHSILELQERAYEELQAANEEVVSTNEEFQTLNEELETSKEEIEASNEELISTNHELRMHNELLAESYNYSQTIIATIHEPMIILDKNLYVKSANTAFYKRFGGTKEETESRLLFELGNRQWNIPKLRETLEDILSQNSHLENFEVSHTFPGLGEKVLLLNASRIIQKTHQEKLILLAIEDITELTRYYLKEQNLLKSDILIHEEDKVNLERAVAFRTKQLNEKNEELENANKDLTSFTYLSSHDLQEPLCKIQTFVGRLIEEENQNLSEDGKLYLGRTYDTATHMRELIDDLLNYSRAKNNDLTFEKIDLRKLLKEVENEYDEIIEKRKVVIELNTLCNVNVVAFQFRQLLTNLIGNSIKFAKKQVLSESS